MNDRQGICSQPKGEKTQSSSEGVSQGSLNPCFETTATETFLPERFQLHASEFIDKVYQRWRENGQYSSKSSSVDRNMLVFSENSYERNTQQSRIDSSALLDRSSSPGCLNLPAGLAPSRLNQKSVKRSFKTKISQDQAKPVVLEGVPQFHKASFGNKQFQFVDDSIGFFYNLETGNRKLPLKIQELQKQQQLLKKQKEQVIRESLIDSSKKGLKVQQNQEGNILNIPGSSMQIADNENNVQLLRQPNQCILKLNEQYCESINGIKKHQQHDEQLVQKKLKKMRMLKLKQISIMSEQSQGSQVQQKRNNGFTPENDFTFNIVHPADAKVDLITPKSKGQTAQSTTPTTSPSQKGNYFSQSQESETAIQAQDSYELPNRQHQHRYSYQINDFCQKQCRIRLPQLQNQYRNQKQHKQELQVNGEKGDEENLQKRQNLLQHGLVFEQMSQDSSNTSPIKSNECQGFSSQEKVQNNQKLNTQYSKSYSSSPRNHNRSKQITQHNDYYNNRSNNHSIFSSPKVLSINSSPRVFSSEPREVLRKEPGRRAQTRNIKLETLQRIQQNPFDQGFSKDSVEFHEQSVLSSESKIHNSSSSMRVTALKQKQLLFNAGASKELSNQKRLQSDKKHQRIKEDNGFQQQQQHMKISRYENGWEWEDKSKLLQKAQQGHLKARLCPSIKELQGRSFFQGNIFDLEGSITRCQVKQGESNIKVRKKSLQFQQPQSSESYQQSKESEGNNMSQEQMLLESWNVHPEELQESVNHLHEYTHK